MATIELKRAYDSYNSDDGFRIYIDRLWPRGLSHENFHYDLWEKNISPSTQLREWFHQDPDGRWEEFVRRYKEELAKNPDFLNLKKIIGSHPKVTLLYSSHDEQHNNAVVLKSVLEGK